MGQSCKPTGGASSTAASEMQRDYGGMGAAAKQMAEKQGQILKPMKGAKMAATRIRRGDILEWYSFEGKVLGSGFGGEIRLAVNRQTGRQYAVKPFSKIGASKDKVSMLRNEASIYLRLDHPNIARLIEIWESPLHAYIVTEYCSGGELYDRLCARKLYPEHAARYVAVQMFSAVNYLHNNKVVHRDLKLENWVFENTEENSKLKLIDLGFSKIWDPKQPKRMHATCGTLAYVSPDILLGGYTNVCDLWSLGVIVYILLVGYPPFYGTEEEMFSRILNGQYSLTGPRWDRISPTAKEFIRRLLVKDGSKRMTAQEALQHPWLAEVFPAFPSSLELAVVESLHRFAKTTRFQRAVLSLIAYSMTSSQIRAIDPTIYDVIISLGKNKEGTIRFEDLQEVLYQDHPEISVTELAKIFKAIAGVGNDRIHFNDFLAAMLTFKLPLDDELIRYAFHKFDTDRTGFISFQNAVETLCDDDRYTEAKLRKVFAEVDLDKSGLIDYSMFSFLAKPNIESAETQWNNSARTSRLTSPPSPQHSPQNSSHNNTRIVSRESSDDKDAITFV